ncbi:MAG: WD40 repeat domain-containing protein [Sphingobacteriaceae bacterium]|nr:MAG: WD40 repeat domain-containing protein [Sphingobacteriaceae bacterium]
MKYLQKLWVPALLLCMAATQSKAQNLYHRIDSAANMVQAISFNRDGALFAVITEHNGTEATKSTLTIYSASTEKKISEISFDTYISWAKFSPDNTRLFVGDADVLRLGGGGAGSTFYMLDISNPGSINIVDKQILGNRITAFDYHKNGQYYAMGFNDGMVALFDANTNGIVFKAQHDNNIKAVKFLYNGMLAVHEQYKPEVYLYSIKDKILFSRIPSANKYNLLHMKDAPEAAKVLFCFGYQAYMYQVTNMKPGKDIKAQYDLEISPNGEMIIVLDKDRLKVYNADMESGSNGTIKYKRIPDEKYYYHFENLQIGNGTKVVFNIEHNIYCGDYSAFLALAGKK